MLKLLIRNLLIELWIAVEQRYWKISIYQLRMTRLTRFDSQPFYAAAITVFEMKTFALRCIKSNLSERSQFVCVGYSLFETDIMRLQSSSRIGLRANSLHPLCRISQLFHIFSPPASPVVKVADTYGVMQQRYADYRHLCIAMFKISSDSITFTTAKTTPANGLALNLDKSEAVLFSKAQRAKEFETISTVETVGSTFALSNKIELHDVTLDENPNFNDQIKMCAKHVYFKFLSHDILVFV